MRSRFQLPKSAILFWTDDNKVMRLPATVSANTLKIDNGIIKSKKTKRGRGKK